MEAFASKMEPHSLAHTVDPAVLRGHNQYGQYPLLRGYTAESMYSTRYYWRACDCMAAWLADVVASWKHMHFNVTTNLGWARDKHQMFPRFHVCGFSTDPGVVTDLAECRFRLGRAVCCCSLAAALGHGPWPLLLILVSASTSTLPNLRHHASHARPASSHGSRTRMETRCWGACSIFASALNS